MLLWANDEQLNNYAGSRSPSTRQLGELYLWLPSDDLPYWQMKVKKLSLRNLVVLVDPMRQPGGSTSTATFPHPWGPLYEACFDSHDP